MEDRKTEGKGENGEEERESKKDNKDKKYTQHFLRLRIVSRHVLFKTIDIVFIGHKLIAT